MELETEIEFKAVPQLCCFITCTYSVWSTMK